jgi:HTH-type transcriptional regulator / antitoxin HipB
MVLRALNQQQLAQALRLQRRRLGLTQSDLAKQSGLLPKTISALENKPGSCQLSSLLKLLMALDLNLGLLEKPDPTNLAQTDW